VIAILQPEHLPSTLRGSAALASLWSDNEQEEGEEEAIEMQQIFGRGKPQTLEEEQKSKLLEAASPNNQRKLEHVAVIPLYKKILFALPFLFENFIRFFHHVFVKVRLQMLPLRLLTVPLSALLC